LPLTGALASPVEHRVEEAIHRAETNSGASDIATLLKVRCPAGRAALPGVGCMLLGTAATASKWAIAASARKLVLERKHPSARARVCLSVSGRVFVCVCVEGGVAGAGWGVSGGGQWVGSSMDV